MTLPAFPKKDPRDLDIGPIRLTATGLEFLAVPSFEDWLGVVEWVKRCDMAVQFWAGDLVNHGENLFNESASQGFDRETWRRWGWVCSKVSPDIRRKALSFTHHEAVARLEPREQRHWLDRAEREGWSANELKRQLKAEVPKEDEPERETCPVCGKPR
jgi:hypothetical protein